MIRQARLLMWPRVIMKTLIQTMCYLVTRQLSYISVETKIRVDESLRLAKGSKSALDGIVLS